MALEFFFTCGTLLHTKTRNWILLFQISDYCSSDLWHWSVWPWTVPMYECSLFIFNNKWTYGKQIMIQYFLSKIAILDFTGCLMYHRSLLLLSMQQLLNVFFNCQISSSQTLGDEWCSKMVKWYFNFILLLFRTEGIINWCEVIVV